MQRLKLIRSLCLLSALIVGVILVGVVNAQTPTVRLSINPSIPATDPYCDGNYPAFDFNPATEGAHLCSAITVTSSRPSDVVDWVLFELRAVDNSEGNTAYTDAIDNNQNTTVIARKPAFLLSNGRVVDAANYSGRCNSATVSGVDATDNADNCPDVVFDEGDVASQLDNKDLYLVIRHRNHLDIISNDELTQASSGVYTYDFSSGVSQAGGLNALKMKSGVSAMPGGDADGDNAPTIIDYTGSIRVDERIDASGYLDTDIDMDSVPTLIDYTSIGRENERLDLQSRVP